MKTIGFSTGALARDNFKQALRMLADKPVNAIELSALRQVELAPLVEQLQDIDLRRYAYIAFHAPSLIDAPAECEVLRLLDRVAALEWPIIVHPDVMQTPSNWAHLGGLLCIENMDKRKPIGQTASDLGMIFDGLPNATFCFDVGHARQVDPTMSGATAILQQFGTRLRQLHVSEVNTQSKHDPLSFESILAFHRVSHLIPPEIPIILESRVGEEEIVEEVTKAIEALSTETLLALAGD